MPMLLYWPLIVWMGMIEAAQKDMRVKDMRVAVKVPKRRS